jgi:hypothetical protein
LEFTHILAVDLTAFFKAGVFDLSFMNNAPRDSLLTRKPSSGFTISCSGEGEFDMQKIPELISLVHRQINSITFDYCLDATNESTVTVKLSHKALVSMDGSVREVGYTVVENNLQMASKLRKLLYLKVLLVSNGQERIMVDLAHVYSSGICSIK